MSWSKLVLLIAGLALALLVCLPRDCCSMEGNNLKLGGVGSCECQAFGGVLCLP